MTHGYRALSNRVFGIPHRPITKSRSTRHIRYEKDPSRVGLLIIIPLVHHTAMYAKNTAYRYGYYCYDGNLLFPFFFLFPLSIFLIRYTNVITVSSPYFRNMTQSTISYYIDVGWSYLKMSRLFMLKAKWVTGLYQRSPLFFLSLSRLYIVPFLKRLHLSPSRHSIDLSFIFFS